MILCTNIMWQFKFISWQLKQWWQKSASAIFIQNLDNSDVKRSRQLCTTTNYVIIQICVFRTQRFSRNTMHALIGSVQGSPFNNITMLCSVTPYYRTPAFIRYLLGFNYPLKISYQPPANLGASNYCFHFPPFTLLFYYDAQLFWSNNINCSAGRGIRGKILSIDINIKHNISVQHRNIYICSHLSIREYVHSRRLYRGCRLKQARFEEVEWIGERRFSKEATAAWETG